MMLAFPQVLTVHVAKNSVFPKRREKVIWTRAENLERLDEGAASLD
jgi:2'-5' RNA ligase